MSADAIEQLRVSTTVLRAQLGEQRAFAELWEMYNLRLSCFVRWIAGPAVEVDDLLQDIWLAVYQKIRTVKSAGAFPAWLYRVARNRAYTARGRHARYKKVLEHLHETAVDTPGNDIDEHILLEDCELLRTCLDQLEPQHHEVLLLRFLEDMSYQQMVDATGCRLGTVRSRIYYAKGALKKAMERKRHERR